MSTNHLSDLYSPLLVDVAPDTSSAAISTPSDLAFVNSFLPEGPLPSLIDLNDTGQYAPWQVPPNPPMYGFALPGSSTFERDLGIDQTVEGSSELSMTVSQPHTLTLHVNDPLDIHASNVGPAAGTQVAPSDGGGGGAIDPAILHTIQKTCRDLIGCNEKVRRTADRDEAPYWDLEKSMTVGGASKRKAPDGVSQLWCPDWKAAVNESTNVEVIEAIVQYLYQKVPAAQMFAHARIKRCVQQYLRTLRGQRRLRASAEGSERRNRKLQRDARRARRKTEVDNMRTAVIPLRKYLGYTNSQGLGETIQTDWDDSQWSSRGETDPEGRAQFRIAAGVSQGNLEERPRQWPSYQLRRIYAALKGVYSALPTTRADNPVLPALAPTDDGIDYTNSERETFLTFVRQNIDRRPPHQRQYVRYCGRPSSNTHPPRPTTKSVVYKEFISEEWAACDLENKKVRDKAPTCAGYYTVMDAEIPDDFIVPRARVSLRTQMSPQSASDLRRL